MNIRNIPTLISTEISSTSNFQDYQFESTFITLTFLLYIITDKLAFMLTNLLRHDHTNWRFRDVSMIYRIKIRNISAKKNCPAWQNGSIEFTKQHSKGELTRLGCALCPATHWQGKWLYFSRHSSQLTKDSHSSQHCNMSSSDEIVKPELLPWKLSMTF